MGDTIIIDYMDKEHKRKEKDKLRKRIKREKQKKEKEDLLLKNYKNRVAVAKCRSNVGKKRKYKRREKKNQRKKQIICSDFLIVNNPKLLGLSAAPVKSISVQWDTILEI